jgi:hypothetical protein
MVSLDIESIDLIDSQIRCLYKKTPTMADTPESSC